MGINFSNGGSDWKSCGLEGSMCQIPSNPIGKPQTLASVAFSKNIVRNGKQNTIDFDNPLLAKQYTTGQSVPCTNANFGGDPAYGSQKACYYNITQPANEYFTQEEGSSSSTDNTTYYIILAIIILLLIYYFYNKK